jgi:hypothetical protein
MTLADIKEQIMFQTNNDADDLEDFEPHINDYVNDGYDRIVTIWDNRHVPSEDYPALLEEEDEPNLPEWMHRYITDWATWLVYRNGNPQKQQRGRAYYESFMWLLSRIADSGGKAGLDENGNPMKYRNFRNIPV